MLIGNDIVWLHDPQNVGRHADLLLMKRILTPRERLLVQVSQDQDRMLWSLWAAKEATFKAVSREHPGTVFSPIRFEVAPQPGLNTATVVFRGLNVPVTWVQGPDWVHALAGEDLAGLGSAVEKGVSGEDESVAVREFAARLLAGSGAGRVEGRPPLFRLEAGGEIPVSLSHDGPYLAVAFRSLER